MNKSLQKIIRDSTSGSSELLQKLAHFYLSKSDSESDIRKLLAETGENFNSFAVIKKYLNKIKQALTKSDNELLRAIISEPLSKQNLYKQMFIHAYEYIKDCKYIYTFSNSKTVYEVLILLNEVNKNLTVYLSESRPRNEGRIFAKKLLKKNIKIIFGTDFQSASFIDKCDAVFCGADALLRKKTLINKTGTLSAAVCAGYFNKPFYVFAETEKRTGSYDFEMKSPSEIWKFKSKKLKIENLYFEKVPVNLVSKVFTEKGTL